MLVGCSSRMLLVGSLVLIGVKLISGLEDASPVTTLTYSLVEEQAVGSELGDLLEDTGLTASLNRSLRKQIYFTILPGKYK